MGVGGGGIRLLDRILKVEVQIISGLRPIFHWAVGSFPLGGFGGMPPQKILKS